MYNIEDFRKINKSENIVISLHGQLRLNERNITVDDVMNAINNGEIMKCIKCGNNTFESTTTEAIELGNGVLVIRNIPCYKCEFCDEIHFTGDVVKRLESIINSVKQQTAQLAVVDFSKVLNAA